MVLVGEEAWPHVKPVVTSNLPPLNISLDLSLGATYIPQLAGLGQSMDAMAIVPVASALLGPVVGLASAKAVLSHFRCDLLLPLNI